MARSRTAGDGYHASYPTWGALLTDVETRGPSEGFAPYCSRRGGFRGIDDADGWSGAATFADAIRLARFGWPEGEQRIMGAARRLADRVASRIEQTDWRYAVEGDALDVAAVVTGRPECWLSEETRSVDGAAVRHVHVVVNPSGSAGVPASTWEGRGIGLAACVLALEHAGARVTIDVVHAMPEGPFRLDVRVKDPEQPLDVGRLAFAMAHAAFFRRIVFASMEHADGAVARAIGHGYGRGYTVEAPAGGITLPSLYDGQPCDWNNPAAVEQWTVDTLKAQGFALRD